MNEQHLDELRARIEALEGLHKAAVNLTLQIFNRLAERVEALERTQRPPHQDKFDRMLALQDQIRDGALTLADAVKEIGSKTTIRPPVERNPECLANWPGCYEGGYNPHCCRFPKPCSCEVRQDAPANSSASLTSSPAGSLVEPVGPDPGYEKGYAQEHLARLMRDAIGTETNHNAYILAAGKILDRPEFAHVARWGAPNPITEELK